MKFKIQVHKCGGMGVCVAHTNEVDLAGCDSAETVDFS